MTRSKLIYKMYSFFTEFLNFVILGRVKVMIQTPQFLGSQENYYLLKQPGWLYLTTLKFTPIKELGGKHVVYFGSIKEAWSAIIKWI